jgi:multicomponent Na+:H+ antiporter subunit D
MGAWFILIPLLSLMVISLFSQKQMKTIAFWWIILLSLLQIVLAIAVNGNFWNGPFPLINFEIFADQLSRLMLLSIGIVLFSTLLAAESWIQEDERKFNFYNILLVLLAGMNGIVLVKDIFTLYVFLEITAVASFIIIALKKERDGLEGAFKYLIFSSIATVMLLTSIALILLVTGDTSFTGIAAGLKASASSPVISLAIGLYLCGLFIKSGLMPFHGWLPDAYAASTSSVSLLLAGIVTKTVGVYPLIRIVYSVFGFNSPIQNVLLLVGAVSIVFGALAALGQNDFKRILAYSSISQVGYIIIGLGCGTPLGMAGAILHLFNHSIFKSLLFLNAGTVKAESGLRNMDQMGGLAGKMPVTGATSAIAALSTAGLPPLSGFWSKLAIVIALWQANYHYYALIAILASIITLSYMLSIQRRVFFGKLANGLENIKEGGLGPTLPAVILAAIIIVVGLFFPLFINSIIFPAGSIL